MCNSLLWKVCCLTVYVSSLVSSPAAFGQDTIAAHLYAIDALSLEALRASQSAEAATRVDAIKQQADIVFRTVWGQSAGLAEDEYGALAMHGWKTRWQTSGTEFDVDHVLRHGDTPPKVTDITQLGIIGRGRQVRKLLQGWPPEDNMHVPHIIASLNNVIGWMRLDDGITKAERQPRIDLTYIWDAPSAFWNTTADTGWLHEVFAQAINILKTDYQGDLDMARNHAAAMTQLIQKCRDGIDANSDGTIAPVMMEGGITTALIHARLGKLMP